MDRRTGVTMTAPTNVTIAGGTRGSWRVTRMSQVTGDGLAAIDRLNVIERASGHPVAPSDDGAIWHLRGYTSNSRYTTAAETSELRAIQADLGRPQATLAALIPIRKSDEWWQLAQDERRTILGEQSRHISIGLEYLPGVARRLYHCREFGEPFDFLTWFEYPPSESSAFERLVERLRATREWHYVDRELDIRLVRD
jgi:chlorite dismutase